MGFSGHQTFFAMAADTP